MINVYNTNDSYDHNDHNFVALSLVPKHKELLVPFLDKEFKIREVEDYLGGLLETDVVFSTIVISPISEELPSWDKSEVDNFLISSMFKYKNVRTNGNKIDMSISQGGYLYLNISDSMVGPSLEKENCMLEMNGLVSRLHTGMDLDYELLPFNLEHRVRSILKKNLPIVREDIIISRFQAMERGVGIYGHDASNEEMYSKNYFDNYLTVSPKMVYFYPEGNVIEGMEIDFDYLNINDLYLRSYTGYDEYEFFLMMKENMEYRGLTTSEYVVAGFSETEDLFLSNVFLNKYIDIIPLCKDNQAYAHFLSRKCYYMPGSEYGKFIISNIQDPLLLEGIKKMYKGVQEERILFRIMSKLAHIINALVNSAIVRSFFAQELHTPYILEDLKRYKKCMSKDEYLFLKEYLRDFFTSYCSIRFNYYCQDRESIYLTENNEFVSLNFFKEKLQIVENFHKVINSDKDKEEKRQVVEELNKIEEVLSYLQQDHSEDQVSYISNGDVIPLLDTIEKNIIERKEKENKEELGKDTKLLVCFLEEEEADTVDFNGKIEALLQKIAPDKKIVSSEELYQKFLLKYGGKTVKTSVPLGTEDRNIINAYLVDLDPTIDFQEGLRVGYYLDVFKKERFKNKVKIYSPLVPILFVSKMGSIMLRRRRPNIIGYLYKKGIKFRCDTRVDWLRKIRNYWYYSANCYDSESIFGEIQSLNVWDFPWEDDNFG